MKHLGFLLLCMWICLPGLPEPYPASSSDWDLARAAYDSGKYEKALRHYSILREQGSSADLEYNMGNALFRSGRPYESIARYRRALWLAPLDPDIRANLRQVENETKALIPKLPVSRRLTGFLSPGTWQTVFLICCWVAGGVGILTTTTSILKSSKLWVLPVLGCLLIFSGFGLLFSRPTGLATEGVLSAKSVTARFEPLDDATEHFSLPGGSVVTVQESARNWVQISSGEKTGWVSKSDLIQLQDL